MNKLLRYLTILLLVLVNTITFANTKTWMDGSWIGLKYQVNAYKKWQMTLDLNAAKKLFTVYYPELDCKGTLELVQMNEQEAIFIEKITGGYCLSDGYIIVKKVDAECIAFICYRDNRTRLASYAVLQPNSDNYQDKKSWEKLNDKGTKLYADVFETMRQQAEKEYGKNHLNYAFALNNLALFYDNQVEYQKAFPLYQETASIYKEVSGEKTEAYILALDNLAGFYKNSGKIGEAELVYQEVLNKRKELLGDKHPNYITSLNNLGLLYLNSSNYTKAEPLLLASLNKTKEVFGEQSVEYSSAIYNLASLYRYEGNFDESKRYYELAIDISLATWGKDNVYYISAIESLADYYKTQREYKKAETLTLEAIELYKKDVIHNKFSIVNAFFNLTNTYLAQERYKDAETLLLDVIRVQKELSGTNNPDYGNQINSLALVYEQLGDHSKSAALYSEAAVVFKKVLGESSISYLIALQNLASAYSKQKNFIQADSLYTAIKPIAETIFGKNHLSYSSVLLDMALYYQRQAKFVLAENSYREAIKVMFSQIETNFSILSEKEKALFYKTFSYRFEIFTSFALMQSQRNPALLGEVYNNQLFTKALLFNTTNKMKERIMASNDDVLKKLFNEWQFKKEYLSKIYQLPFSEKEAQHIDEKLLEQEVNSIEKKLSLQSEAFGSANDTKHPTWQEVQNALKQNEAAVEMVRLDFYNGSNWTDTIVYLALIIKPGSSFPEVVKLYQGKDLENRYARYYTNAIRFKTEDTYSYTHYWKQIQEKLAGVKKVYFSPDGVYNQINLQTLKNTQTGKYLIDEIDIQLVSNTKDLLKVKSLKQSSKEVILIGFPDYNNEKAIGTDRSIPSKLQLIEADTSQRFFTGNFITNLPGTKKEVDNISYIFIKNKLKTANYTEQEASEVLIKSLKDPRVLHIATHGFFMRDVQTNSENERGLMGMNAKTVVENPLLRSGLLFANAKQAFIEGGDGILTSYEVMNLNLDETDLVVMSACETGLGEISNGEGVYGLQRAFQTAGAKTILMSLWSVSDAATQELMTLFYENWITQKKSKRQAFKNAQQVLKVKYPEPYYWGAFVMVGE